MKKIISIFCLAGFLSTNVLGKLIKVHVPEMVCQMCVQGMQKAFKGHVKDSKKDILVDLDKKIVTLITAEDLSDAFIKKKVEEVGYSASKIERQN